MKDKNIIFILDNDENIDNYVQKIVKEYQINDYTTIDSFNENQIRHIPINHTAIVKNFDFWSEANKRALKNTLNNPTIIITKLSKIRVWSENDEFFFKNKLKSLKHKRSLVYQHFPNEKITLKKLDKNINNMENIMIKFNNDIFLKMIFGYGYKVMGTREMLELFI